MRVRTPLLYKADFEGMRVRVIEQRGNPCTQPELREHFYPWYKTVNLFTTPQNRHVASGYWHMKLVMVKPSWNIALKQRYHDKHALIIGIDEVITHISYAVDIVDGRVMDTVDLTLKSMDDGFKYLASIRIEHGAIPLVRMK